jgi:transcriptional regulator with XRE-family HTH domain
MGDGHQGRQHQHGLNFSHCERAALRHRRLGHTQAELAKILGSRSRASEILSRRRPLTLDMIQKINARWKIPADLLVQPYRVSASAA